MKVTKIYCLVVDYNMTNIYDKYKHHHSSIPKILFKRQDLLHYPERLFYIHIVKAQNLRKYITQQTVNFQNFTFSVVSIFRRNIQGQLHRGCRNG